MRHITGVGEYMPDPGARPPHACMCRNITGPLRGSGFMQQSIIGRLSVIQDELAAIAEELAQAAAEYGGSRKLTSLALLAARVAGQLHDAIEAFYAR